MRALLLAVVLLAVPASAHAAEVRLSADSVVVVAAAGEVNAIKVEKDGGEAIVRDGGVPATAGPGCRQAAPDEVRCPADTATSIAVRTDDGNDTIDLAHWPEAVNTEGTNCGEGTDSIRLPRLTSFPKVPEECERVPLTSKLAFEADLNGFGPRGVKISFHVLVAAVTARIEAKFHGKIIAARSMALTGPGRRSRRLPPTKAHSADDQRAGWITLLVRRRGLRPIGIRIFLSGGGT